MKVVFECPELLNRNLNWHCRQTGERFGDAIVRAVTTLLEQELPAPPVEPSSSERPDPGVRRPPSRPAARASKTPRRPGKGGALMPRERRIKAP